MSKIGPCLGQGTLVKSYVAVVDCIQDPSQHEMFRGERAIAQLKTKGHDGIAYLATLERDWQPSLDTLSSQFLNNGPEREKEREKTITIHICTQSDPNDPMGIEVYKIKVPLANTIFQNGLSYTAFTYQWRVRYNGKFCLTKQDKLSGMELHWPQSLSSPNKKCSVSLSTNLYPLTAPRAIASSMGNIVRSLSKRSTVGKEDQSEASEGLEKEDNMRASKELEQAISMYFKFNPTEAATLDTWALVSPPELVSNYYGPSAEQAQREDLFVSQSDKFMLDYWNSRDQLDNDSLLSRIKAGARLRRVVSGGGGWGDRAGLLALDPQSEYGANTHSSNRKSFEQIYDNIDTAMDLKPGNFIQFFVQKKCETGILPEKAVRKDKCTDLFGQFGVTSTSSPVLDSDGQAGSKSGILIPNIYNYNYHFGAASEKGFSLNGWTKHGCEGETQDVFCTKVDVPDSFICLNTKDMPASLGKSSCTEDNLALR